MIPSEIERLQQELTRERAARAEAEARHRDVERELLVVAVELRHNVSAFQKMALRHQGALVRLAGLSPNGEGMLPVQRELTDATELRCEELYERGPDQYGHGVVLRVADYPRYFEALRLGRAIDGHEARRDPRTSEFAAGYLEPLGITSMLDAAVRREGEVVGVVCLEHVGPPRTWTDAEMEFAGALADQAALARAAMERHRLEEERAWVGSELMRTRALALQDELTGLANRPALEVLLADEAARAVRHRRPLSILMADVDRSRRSTTSTATRRATRCCASRVSWSGSSGPSTRRPGTAARRWASSCPTAVTEACSVAERVPRLTVSFGVAGTSGDAATPERLVELADRARYDAKHRGRNRVVAVDERPA